MTSVSTSSRILDAPADGDGPPLVYLVPSRGRPRNIADLVDAWSSTAAGGYAMLLVAIDDDDPTGPGYLELELPEWAELYVGPRLRLGGTLNALAPRLAAGFSGIGFMGDDHRPRSARWDERLYDLLEPGSIIYGNDLIQGAALPTAVLLESTIIDIAGYYVPPGMLHLWLDNYWLELGRRLRTIRYDAELIIEHAHPIAGRAEWDDGYRENNADAVNNADRAHLERYIAGGELDELVARITLELDRRRH